MGVDDGAGMMCWSLGYGGCCAVATCTVDYYGAISSVTVSAGGKAGGFTENNHSADVEKADFGTSLPAPSADALPATLHGYSTWRPLSRVER
jgi:hypothetical protein